MIDKENLQNAKLDDEELENVAGGTMYQMEKDIQHFKELGVLSDRTDEHDKDAIRRAFRAFGIEAEPHGGCISGNEYTYRGDSISRKEAWNIVQDQYYLDNYRPRVN